jgi:hypothetical protein
MMVTGLGLAIAHAIDLGIYAWNGFSAVFRGVSLLRLPSHLARAVPPAVSLGFHPSASSLRPGSLAILGFLPVVSETDRRAISPSETLSL